MNTSLQLKVSQNLALTPQLQQSIRLLQLSTLELQQEIRQALTDNPLLELADEDKEHNGTDTANFSLENDGSLNTSPTEQPTNLLNTDNAHPLDHEHSTDHTSDFEQDTPLNLNDHFQEDWHLYTNSTNPDGEEEKPAFQLAAPESNLHTHLTEQLQLSCATERDKNLVLWLIDYLNDNGYLTVSLEELYQTLQGVPDLEFEELNAALKLLQSFDPAGVGARTPAECLLLQLEQANNLGICNNLKASCKSLIENHLEQLASHDYTKIRKTLQLNEHDLKICLQTIRSLNPWPGAPFRRTEETPTIPDVMVLKLNGKWTVQLNKEVMPRIQINDMYARILRNNRGQNAQLSAQLQEARWLIKNLQQRFETISRVSQAIVARQTTYFDQGEVGMKPLILREIADELNLHESTISRVTTQKYMLTPHGLVELKYFFGSHVATDNGGQASSTAIRALIKQLIAAEDSKKPISDSQIAETLGTQGIVVARRTVAKYRESLKIPPVNMRKSL